MVFAVVLLATLLVLVTSVSTLARSPIPYAALQRQQQVITPTPAESGDSIAGSTDGIVWMGMAIAAVVILPVLLSRALWARQP